MTATAAPRTSVNHDRAVAAADRANDAHLAAMKAAVATLDVAIQTARQAVVAARHAAKAADDFTTSQEFLVDAHSLTDELRKLRDLRAQVDGMVPC